MANEFVIKNGYLSKDDSQITGSLFVSGDADIEIGSLKLNLTNIVTSLFKFF